MTLWTASDAAAATGGRASGWDTVSGISIDTRELAPGDLFVALEGISHDGHVYVGKALEAGAGAAMVSHVPDDVPADAPLLVVGDTLEALRRLGAAARARTNARIIAVTGSVGKTSTKDMLREMLSAQGRTHAAIRSFNNHWGVPLTLARMPSDTEYAVIEIGMNHAGEITPLSKLAMPHVALITTVEAVHLENFASVEGIADAKAEIFAGLQPGGLAVLPADNRYLKRLQGAAAPHRVTEFGTTAEVYKLTSVDVSDTETVATAQIAGRAVSYSLATRGAHFAMNALGALAAVECVGGDLDQAARDLVNWTPPAGRGAVIRIPVPGGEITLLDESYNANPASLGAALDVLAATPTGARRMALLGDMLELGPGKNALHAGVADHPALNNIDLVHTCGPLMAHLHTALPDIRRGQHCVDSQELAGLVPKVVDAGDVCMVKGSLGARMAVVVDAIKGLGARATQDVDGDA